MITFDALKEITPENLVELQALSDVLHTDGRKLSEEGVAEVLKNPLLVCIVARDGAHIVGMGSLYLIPKMGKVSAYIEDVVVRDSYRGQGAGKGIMKHLIEVARERNVVSISLTSRDGRTSAHALYEKMGFEKVDTNVFRLVVEK